MDNAWFAAFSWLCRQRRKAPPNAGVWHLWWRWSEDGPGLYREVISGHYRLSPMQIYSRGKEASAMWSAQDALVLKWLALSIEHQLPQHEACMHLRGRGVRRSLREVAEKLKTGQYRFVHRTDIRGYYRHIRKPQIISLVNQWVTDPVHRQLIEQYVYYSVEWGGDIHTPVYGIPRSCALSPLIGGSLLYHTDQHFREMNPDDVFYVRYMDDFLLLTRTRWQLRRGIAQLAHFLELSGFERHPGKTQTGRLENGFDWLGFWFGSDGVSPSPRALQNHHDRCLRLFEQARKQGASEEEARLRVQKYRERWIKLTFFPWGKGYVWREIVIQEDQYCCDPVITID